jgi:hypothetical protein
LHGIETYIPKEEQYPDAHPAPIAPILAALEHFQGHRTDAAAPHFVTFRNNLNKIMGVRPCDAVCLISSFFVIGNQQLTLVYPCGSHHWCHDDTDMTKKDTI